MEKNVGETDRIVRVIVGLIFLIFGVIYNFSIANSNMILTILVFLVAIIFLGTGIAGYCTLYLIMGTDTCSVE